MSKVHELNPEEQSMSAHHKMHLVIFGERRSQYRFLAYWAFSWFAIWHASGRIRRRTV
jgi:uncharacterized membrane protein